jgi:glycosyltransferase involved in cell wall biosynthesis
MIGGLKVVVVMPAYNAEQTLLQTYQEIPREVVDEIILVDDGSHDATVERARELDLHLHIHERNLGYGANQKTCYRLALERGADIVVMLHPDYQYSPRLVTAMASMVASGHYDVVLGSRILGSDAIRGGMPLYKYLANRGLTLAENLLLGTKLSEFHTGYRAYAKKVLLSLPLHHNSDDFVFDNQILAQAVFLGFSIGEISCPTRYFPEASSINFVRSCRYGLGVLGTALLFRLHRFGIARSRLFAESGWRLESGLDGGG